MCLGFYDISVDQMVDETIALTCQDPIILIVVL